MRYFSISAAAKWKLHGPWGAVPLILEKADLDQRYLVYFGTA
jgi:hypothetical protein